MTRNAFFGLMALNFVCLNNDSKHWNKVSENFGKYTWRLNNEYEKKNNIICINDIFLILPDDCYL